MGGVSPAVTLAVVLAGGPPPVGTVTVPPDAIVIAADSGGEHAFALGLPVDIVIGDLDSISQASLDALQVSGARLERHPAAKDASDLELALDRALELGAERILVVGGAGGRLDHLLAELLLLAADRYATVPIDAHVGSATVHVVRGERTFTGRPGDVISLFAVHGPAEGVVTHGLLYPLNVESLVPGSTRGLSNAFVLEEARVRVERGVVIAVRPLGEARPPH